MVSWPTQESLERRILPIFLKMIFPSPSHFYLRSCNFCHLFFDNLMFIIASQFPDFDFYNWPTKKWYLLQTKKCICTIYTIENCEFRSACMKWMLPGIGSGPIPILSKNCKKFFETIPRICILFSWTRFSSTSFSFCHSNCKGGDPFVGCYW